MRKACAHAFYKRRLTMMMLVVKEKVEEWIDERNREIDSSIDSNKTVVDIGLSFERMFSKIITHICFGEDISSSEVDIEYTTDPIGFKYNKKKMCIPEALK